HPVDDVLFDDVEELFIQPHDFRISCRRASAEIESQVGQLRKNSFENILGQFDAVASSSHRQSARMSVFDCVGIPRAQTAFTVTYQTDSANADVGCVFKKCKETILGDFVAFACLSAGETPRTCGL